MTKLYNIVEYLRASEVDVCRMRQWMNGDGSEKECSYDGDGTNKVKHEMSHVS
jgi:hypothetical protein